MSRLAGPGSGRCCRSVMAGSPSPSGAVTSPRRLLRRNPWMYGPHRPAVRQFIFGQKCELPTTHAAKGTPRPAPLSFAFNFNCKAYSVNNKVYLDRPAWLRTHYTILRISYSTSLGTWFVLSCKTTYVTTRALSLIQFSIFQIRALADEEMLRDVDLLFE